MKNNYMPDDPKPSVSTLKKCRICEKTEDIKSYTPHYQNGGKAKCSMWLCEEDLKKLQIKHPEIRYVEWAKRGKLLPPSGYIVESWEAEKKREEEVKKLRLSCFKFQGMLAKRDALINNLMDRSGKSRVEFTGDSCKECGWSIWKIDEDVGCSNQDCDGFKITSTTYPREKYKELTLYGPHQRLIKLNDYKKIEAYLNELEINNTELSQGLISMTEERDKTHTDKDEIINLLLRENERLKSELGEPINFTHGDIELMFHPKESMDKIQNFSFWLSNLENKVEEYKYLGEMLSGSRKQVEQLKWDSILTKAIKGNIIKKTLKILREESVFGCVPFRIMKDVVDILGDKNE